MPTVRIFEHPDCTRCELHEQANSVGMKTHLHSQLTEDPGEGDILLVIGQNPGFHEDRVNQPFVGRSGEILKKAYFGGVDLTSRCTVWLGNGVRCHTENNQTPKPRHYVECNQYLIQDLQYMMIQMQLIYLALLLLLQEHLR